MFWAHVADHILDVQKVCDWSNGYIESLFLNFFGTANRGRGGLRESGPSGRGSDNSSPLLWEYGKYSILCPKSTDRGLSPGEIKCFWMFVVTAATEHEWPRLSLSDDAVESVTAAAAANLWDRDTRLRRRQEGEQETLWERGMKHRKQQEGDEDEEEEDRDNQTAPWIHHWERAPPDWRRWGVRDTAAPPPDSLSLPLPPSLALVWQQQSSRSPSRSIPRAIFYFWLLFYLCHIYKPLLVTSEIEILHKKIYMIIIIISLGPLWHFMGQYLKFLQIFKARRRRNIQYLPLDNQRL